MAQAAFPVTDREGGTTGTLIGLAGVCKTFGQVKSAFLQDFALTDRWPANYHHQHAMVLG